MMGYYGWGSMFPGRSFAGIGIVFNILFALAVAFVIIALIKLFIGGHGKSWRDSDNEEDGAIGILKQRYAKGEITKKEFDQMKKDIS